ncbi:hypothetical protein MAP00_000557 [Monascus purpureus]|nr:hypothetical protein MAP00_000557 [Monascus purpureus]
MASNRDSEHWHPAAEQKHAEPASSFFAVHLAPHIASQGSQAHHLTRETFSQLRQELLGGRYRQLRLDDSVTDVNKLVCVVLKAGLEPNWKEDGLNRKDFKSQITDCLDIIQAAVEKAPQCLTEFADPEILGKGIRAPLFAWLVLRLIDLFNAWNCEDVQKKIGDIFLSIVYSQSKQVRPWPNGLSVPAFLRACTADILQYLESLGVLELKHFSTAILSVPALGESFLGSLNRLGYPCRLSDHSMTLGTFPQAVSLLLLLLDIFVPNSETDIHANKNDSLVRLNRMWALNGYWRLWKVVFFWLRSSPSDMHQCAIPASLQFLASVQNRCNKELPLSAPVPSKTEFTYVWLQSLTELLTLDCLNKLPALHLGLSQSLRGLAECLGHSETFVTCMEDLLLPVLVDVKNDVAFDSLELCLQMTIQDVLESSSHPNLQRLQVKRNNRSFSKMNISGSSVEIQRLSVTCEATDPKDETRAAKRLCLSRDLIKHEDWNPLQQLLTRSFILLRSESSKGIQDLGAAVSDSFAGLSEEDKCKILETLGRISCAIAGGLSRRPSGITTDAEMLCNVCDNEDYENNAPSNMQRSSYDSLREALTVILSQLTRASSPRVAAMVALRRLLMHDSTSNQMQLASSVFGEFCLNSLRSSIRELRLVTGHSVAAFVRTGTGSETRRSNFVIVLEWLKNLSEKNEISLQETCILTLCRLACFSGDEEMNIILLRLLEYLGHSNPFICAVTHTELSKLAQDLSVTPTGLFRPFWRTISITVVKNFQSRPYMAEQLCDLLGMKVDDFLRLTEVHILPYLVLTRKRDLICKVAATYKNTKSPFDICSEKNNLAAILAFLLSQPSSDPEGMIMTLLAEVDPSFKGRTLAELVRTEPILIACDLLKGLGDSGDVKGERYHRALRVLAALVPRKCTSRNAASKRSSSLGHFIEEHVLGIITQFANAVNDFQVRQSLVEKKRNIVAIGEMIKIAGGHVGSALPQV